MRAEQPFAGELASLHELTHGFVATLRLAWLAATRDPAWANSLFWRFVDDLVASAVAIELLVREGIDTTARRELRFMLELVVRHLYVDSCAMAPTSPFETRMGYVGRQLGTRDVELVSDLPLPLLGDKEAFRQATRRLYGELSRYTHPTREQLARRLERADRGAHIGFDTAEDVAAFNELLRRAYDVLIALIFEASAPDRPAISCSPSTTSTTGRSIRRHSSPRYQAASTTRPRGSRVGREIDVRR